MGDRRKTNIFCVFVVRKELEDLTVIFMWANIFLFIFPSDFSSIKWYTLVILNEQVNFSFIDIESMALNMDRCYLYDMKSDVCWGQTFRGF